MTAQQSNAAPKSQVNPAPRANLWRRVLRKVREAGLGYTLKLIFRNVVPPAMLRITRIRVFEIRPAAEILECASDAAFRWASTGDADLFQTLGYERETIQRRLLSERAVIGTESGGIFACLWFRTSPHEEEDVGARFIIGPAEVWAYEGMVKSEQRGRGVYQALLRWAARDLGRAGVPRILIAAEVTNQGAWRAVERIGGTKIGEVLGIRVAGLSFVRRVSESAVAWSAAVGYAPVSVSALV